MKADGSASLFLCGDVMTGRGIDQILPHPSNPRLYEAYVPSATGYVELAENVNGPIPRPADFSYIWGDALAELRKRSLDARVVNLETAVTRSEDAWPKGINYRMNPDNAPCLSAAGINCCVLSNNHVLDWSRAGLVETLDALHRAGIETSGAGMDEASAEAPAVVAGRTGRRVLVFAAATADCGVPDSWAAAPGRPGVHLLPDLSAEVRRRIGANVRRHKHPGDITIFSVHWGENWGYDIPMAQRQFAHGLIDDCGIDLVHGHSSHHVKAMEVYRGHLILYGCGDLLNDYEGIRGHEGYRGDLSLLYFPALDAGGRLTSLEMAPLRIRRFRLERAGIEDRSWLVDTLRREGRAFGSDVTPRPDGTLVLHWS